MKSYALLQVRIPPSLKKIISENAYQERKSVNQRVVEILEEFYMHYPIPETGDNHVQDN